MGQKCTCSAKSNCAEWDPLEECDVLIESIQNETDIRKIAETSHRCLKLMSMNDACEFMVKHQYPITFENIIKFKELTMKFYKVGNNETIDFKIVVFFCFSYKNERIL